MKLRLNLVLLSSPLMACAAVDQPVRFTRGYRDLQLASDVLRVSFQNNGSARQDRVVDCR